MKYRTAIPAIAAQVNPIVAIIDISIMSSFPVSFYCPAASAAYRFIFISPKLNFKPAYFAVHVYREEVIFYTACGFSLRL